MTTEGTLIGWRFWVRSAELTVGVKYDLVRAPSCLTTGLSSRSVHHMQCRPGISALATLGQEETNTSHLEPIAVRHAPNRREGDEPK